MCVLNAWLFSIQLATGFTSLLLVLKHNRNTNSISLLWFSVCAYVSIDIGAYTPEAIKFSEFIKN